MVDVSGTRVEGPLELFASGFAAELTRTGYTPLSASKQLELAAHLSRWLDSEALDVAALTPSAVDAFLVARRARYRSLRSAKALEPLLSYLRHRGVTPALTADSVSDPVDVLVERFRGYLLAERGLTDAAARGYIELIRPFVVICARRNGVGLDELTPGEVTSFMVSESHRLAPKTLQRLASALRSLLRFWYVDGVLAVSLADVVPKVANRRPALPQALQPAHVHALLDSCDLGSPSGLRDFAMLTLLSRTGLRAGEVAGMRLEDIDWRRGEITVRGKGDRHDRLPLPADVGESIVEYLRSGRPVTALDRSVFIRVKAPHRGLTSGGVTQAVAAAGRRAGLGAIYAHRLRHTAATSMLAAGAGLAEIGQVLRHRRPLTTAVYAKVDTATLRTLARPWPAGVS
ncbi:MAG: integrase [Amycolatopsis sp.]|uniref:tyrosine-type recombinase/integrase n=1 Tax=Amycolatopsis sp. TaxID=37632 RepID=UPI002606BC0F|nr:tyrosine-type recombinase/integrase [Amycolatopsis sp.]MCU1684507.1 integrase [Amycolatopsis sp.]